MSIASDTVSSCLTSATWQRDVAKHATSLASLYGSPSIGNWISILMSVRQGHRCANLLGRCRGEHTHRVERTENYGIRRVGVQPILRRMPFEVL